MNLNKHQLAKKEESYSFLDQLNTEKDEKIIEVRVVRFWEVISSGSREPISTDMVIIDERVCISWTQNIISYILYNYQCNLNSF